MSALKERIAVLTGAGGGIGRTIAESLAKEGVKLVLLGGNDQDKLNTTCQAVEKYSSCLTLPGNLADPEFIARSAAEAVKHFGGADILINNAGVAQNCPFEKISAGEFDRIMAINFRAPFLLTQQLLPHLKKSSAATVINIASVVSHAGYPMQSVYTASKHALLGWTKSLAAECYQDNVRVHAISPGGVYTDMVKLSRPDLTPDGMIMPEEIANIVLFFLNNRGNAVIDEIIVHRVNKQPFLV